MDKHFSHAQKKILWACILLYTVAFFNRLNLSAVLSSIMDALVITTAQAGMLQSAFAIVYAAGQLVNGILADRFNPVKYMTVGMLGTALVNLLMGTAQTYPLLLVLCLLNGAFQSMLWTPIVRLLAMYFHTQHHRAKANVLVNVPLVAGHFGAWALSGYLSSALNWRYSFIVPAVLILPALLAGLRLFKGLPDPQPQAVQTTSASAAPQPLLRIFARTGLMLILVVSVLFGFVRDGIITWAPNVLQSLSGGDALTSTTFSLVLPLINAGGLVMGYLIQQRAHQNNRRMIALLMLAGSVLCLPLLPSGGMLLTAVLLGSCCACMYGIEPIITARVPLEYEKLG